MTTLEVVTQMLAEERTARLSAQKEKTELREVLDELGALLVADAKKLNIELHNRMKYADLYRMVMGARETARSARKRARPAEPTA